MANLPYNLKPFVLVETARDLVARYDEPHRVYHNTDHLDHALSSLSNLASILTRKELNATELEEIGLMIWFHDAVYDIGPHVPHGQNERLSADLFMASTEAEMLPGNRAEIVEEGILHSASHTVCYAKHSLTTTQQIFLDIDLCGMGESYDFFLENGEKIRKEYAWVDPDTFKQNRIKFFGALLKRPYIYYNLAMRGMYEAKTRQNINRWLGETL